MNTALTMSFTYIPVVMAANPSQNTGLFQNAHTVYVTNSAITEVTGFNI